jgi:cysteinyl-tRNA synthetase
MGLAFWQMPEAWRLWQQLWFEWLVRLSTMKLFDTRSGGIKQIEPIIDGKLSIYVCGPTVQSEPHIGHLRSALVYDLMMRWAKAQGYDTTLVRNVTDIDDKVLEKAQQLEIPWKQLAEQNEELFRGDYRAIGIEDPAIEPRATDHIPQMIKLIETLIARGHAYLALDGSADVYFDTASWPSYGELTNQKPADMEGEGSSPKKKNPQDFALWKAAKDSEPETASWDSPFGRGRPGWHIECSAMSQHYLGENFDIHGGGLDLRFPHHENELAQSSAAGAKFANYWVHNGLVSINGQKMSKSLGNSVTSKDLLEAASPQAVRYYLLTAHYRSVLDYQPGALQEAATALERLHGFVLRAERELGTGSQVIGEVPSEFATHMNEDLNIPAALAVLHESVREGNSRLDAKDLDSASRVLDRVVSMLFVLGLAPSQWLKQKTDQSLEAEIELLIEERRLAREQKDFARADQIRDQLKAKGIELSDNPSGTHWSID